MFLIIFPCFNLKCSVVEYNYFLDYPDSEVNSGSFLTFSVFKKSISILFALLCSKIDTFSIEHMLLSSLILLCFLLNSFRRPNSILFKLKLLQLPNSVVNSSSDFCKKKMSLQISIVFALLKLKYFSLLKTTVKAKTISSNVY